MTTACTYAVQTSKPDDKVDETAAVSDNGNASALPV